MNEGYLSHGYHMNEGYLSHGCYMGITWVLHEYHMNEGYLSHGCTWVSHESYKSSTYECNINIT